MGKEGNWDGGGVQGVTDFLWHIAPIQFKRGEYRNKGLRREAGDAVVQVSQLLRIE